MQCTKPIRITNNKFPDGLTVPCGKCLACRILKRKEWTIRMLHELESHNNAVFITLTYNDQHLPDHNTLVIRDLQLFFKRLRKKISPEKIRYFACGEYGDNTNRPHYHCIIYGLSFSDHDQSIISSAWPYGFIHYGSVTADSIRYTAQYIDKKFSGDLAQQVYGDTSRIAPFRISSLGIGRDFCDNEAVRLRRDLKVTHRGVPQGLPRYYIKRLNIDSNDVKEKAVEVDSKVVEKYTGVYIDNDTMYKHGNASDVRSLVDGVKRAQKQRELNLTARVNLKTKKL